MHRQPPGVGRAGGDGIRRQQVLEGGHHQQAGAQPATLLAPGLHVVGRPARLQRLLPDDLPDVLPRRHLARERLPAAAAGHPPPLAPAPRDGDGAHPGHQPDGRRARPALRRLPGGGRRAGAGGRPGGGRRPAVPRHPRQRHGRVPDGDHDLVPPAVRGSAGTDAELDPPRVPPPARRVAAGSARQDPAGDPGL